MKNIVLRFGLVVVILVCFAVIGCLVSGTFPIKEDISFSFTADTGYYWYPVDLTTNSDWEDHIDDLDDIDALGFDFWIENTSSTDCEFTVMIMEVDPEVPADPNNPPASINPTLFTTIIEGLSVPAETNYHVTYSESLKYIKNLPAFKSIVTTGRFDFIGLSCGGTGDDSFIVTEGVIIVTVSASDSGS